MIPQRTLKHPIRCSGIGLHSGHKVGLWLRPAPENSGIVFHRHHSEGITEIPALAKFVTDTRMCTTLGRDGVQIGTVEHLLSALAGLGIDNAIIEVDGPEVPIMDGSSAPFVFLIQCAGICEQSAAKKVLRVINKVTVEDGNRHCSLHPAKGFKVSYLLDYDHPLLRQRSSTIDFSTQAYTREVARARTFGFLHEIEALQKAGLALGGSLENAIVLDAFRVVNEGGLRYEDECVRHKILDTVGDLALAGYPVVGAFEGERTGHDMNHRLVSALLADESAWRIEELKAEDSAVQDMQGQAATQPV
ncbi:MAG: UDP-3-O-[3-hydroxymyristoyl] N-acetylglucosamine deacetylase [Zetaproteobacteria bacterium CG12_big_fil_rev_8_21_14_0_65_55_1124]|nr:MAG: UDP-3-O-[3-hydroxymyristoyl] N-acetylglucosamine deacetylase [Zetaproteobacteria bacterium CG1_02_55_237]PIS19917.1 MAG: UDP-3-O-[3-hydroxymyristoyl] N-acetylglucosamine deacetylase [Zetaproteobacteria bacterium CG08_land_8_20_14_0_20_55_17]PIW43660.1 MAG: UDP-3-O-[3-hydroxymyristoyl] N-acetylglucosamine deacetylase [Zetaproteobacteria bacterium CG12_big_fil_rev_8_21_14_0_65_55_1124]PIY52671.1 MAG: UDP-3-O-[3-hydroxymyristoyl] N-acetylglucosamine deacetylase [Zetaproteobacteria bacterium